MDFDGLEKQVSERFGAESQAVFVVRYEAFVHRIRDTVENCSAADEAALAVAWEDLQRRFQNSISVPEIQAARSRGKDDPNLLEYSRSEFEARYANRKPPTLLTLAEASPMKRLPGINLMHNYLYVLDDRRHLRLNNRPLTVRDRLTARALGQDLDMPVHPQLVPERLSVYAAGEMTFVGHSALSAVVANLKSGHYRPTASAAPLLREFLRERLGLPLGRVFVLHPPVEFDA